MADTGLKIAQAGFDVTTCADYQLLFNSAWPSLAIAFAKTVTLLPDGNMTIPHGLKFPPFTEGWIIQNGISAGRVFGLSEFFESEPQISIELSFDDTNIYLINHDSINSFQIHLKCYYLDISTAADYTNPKPAGEQFIYNPDYGIKIVKSGKDIDSTDLRDFSIHSRAQSPAVSSIVTEATFSSDTNLSSITYINSSGYNPWVYAFGGPSIGGKIRYSPIPNGPQQTGFLFQSGATSYLSYANNSGFGGSLVVLRDPLFASHTSSVVY